VQRKGVNHALVSIDQVGAGGFVAGVTAFNKGGFRSVYVGPTDSASVLHQPSGNRRPHQSSTVLPSIRPRWQALVPLGRWVASLLGC
jgi:hypothetical protein